MVVLAALGVCATAAVLYATVPGAGISPDSTAYVGSARNLLRGLGLVTVRWAEGRWVPLTHFPPLFPALLALGGLLGPDPSAVGRVLNAFLMGANVFLLGYSLLRFTGAAWAGVLGAVLGLLAGDVLVAHTWVMAEPLMLLTGFAGLLCLGVYLEDGGRGWLVASAVLTGLALLARYAAVPFLTTGALGVLLLHRASLRVRVRDALAFTALGCALPAAWALRNLWVAGSAANRHLVAHWISTRHLRQAGKVVASWLHPGAEATWPMGQGIYLFGALVLSSILVATLVRRTWPAAGRAERMSPGARWAWLLLIFAATYPVFLVISISWIDFATPMDGRLLCPVHVALIGAVVAVAQLSLPARVSPRSAAAGLLAVVTFILLPRAASVGRTLSDYHREGRGYVSRRWQNREIMGWIERLPDVPIYTNEIAGVYFHTGRLVSSVPLKTDPHTRRPNPELRAELDRMRDDLATRRGRYVELSFGRWRRSFVGRARLMRELGLERIESTSEAEIYAIPARSGAEPEGGAVE